MIKMNMKKVALAAVAILAIGAPMAASAQHVVVEVGRAYDPYYGGYVVYDSYGRWVDDYGNYHYRDGRWFDRGGHWHDRGDWGWRDRARWGDRGGWHDRGGYDRGRDWHDHDRGYDRGHDDRGRRW